ncbi:HTH-type transcriptional repressor of iron proteins A [Actinomadura rubteroloni]|uniref:HTH-type transcriptional repressor of iron proteins A n=1 Tax=Actinomadura rubteroloni TaxID=1926885 RepID=A0A2P4UE59_9ACTN|nr:AraC family transcriptional regulator [Actinomadura rubteroloni]POM23354.1 HTH-type transcriptional repressor of iron proteins A [Actinomadura rubteroloni]
MAREWSRYWRAADRPLEAMHAHFERHAYHRHSHETYSFGVTESGAQAFSCRGGEHTSAAGMVLAFNPDDPHDGHAADALGFTYRIVHIGPELIGAVLSDLTGRRAAPPLFAAPVVTDPLLASRLRSLHAGLLGGASALRRDELLAGAVAAMVGRAATRRLRGACPAAGPRAARIARERLRAAPLADVPADELAAAAGVSRFALYRAFRTAYGMAPSEYQRLLRLRAARRLIAAGRPLADAAAASGFADQSHLTRWFVRCYGVTPGAFRDGNRGECPA